MARMSVAKRIELGNEMVSRWEAANCGNSKNVRFVRDMLVRLDGGRSLTTKQRAWYDSAVVSSPPEPQNKEAVDKLLSDSELPGMEKSAQVLRDFAYKLSRGWSLSEKQESFRKKLQAKADDIRNYGQWVPSESEKRDIEIGVAFCRRYDQYYLSGQPGKAKALRECTEWLAGNIDFLDEWSAQKMMSLCKTDREKMADAASRWPVGSLAQTKKGQLGLVTSEVFVSPKGKPCFSLLLEGSQVNVMIDDLKKDRRKKRGK
tara:strand:- start:3719 stop:4498 length:780 start_codon:yes stop_codon:yes gene_type:complete